MTAFSRHARGGNKKAGTTNKKQAKAREKAAAAARTAAEAMADLAEPPRMGIPRHYIGPPAYVAACTPKGS